MGNSNAPISDFEENVVIFAMTKPLAPNAKPARPSPIRATQHTLPTFTAVATFKTAPNLSGLNQLLAAPAMKDKPT